MDGYYDSHQPLQGTYVPVQHYTETDEEEITEEEIQAFIASLVEEE